SARTSTTSGPMVPPSTGSSTEGLPSLKDRVAMISLLIVCLRESTVSSGPPWPWRPSCIPSGRAPDRAQSADQGGKAGFGRVAASAHPVPQVDVRSIEQLGEGHPLLGRQPLQLVAPEGLQHEVELQHTAPAPPANPVELRHRSRCP